MEFLWAFILGLGLCFDTFAVSISCGIADQRIQFWQGVKVALVLAFFQGLMPVIGWFAGVSVEQYIQSFDHWVALALLTVVGGRMIIGALSHGDETKSLNLSKWSTLITMAIATSIDALAVGISLGLANVNIWITAFIIGVVTFLAAMLGMLIGKNTGHLLGKRMEVLGGLILIGLGVKIVLEHLEMV